MFKKNNMTDTATQKFWLLGNLQEELLERGLSYGYANAITFVAAIVGLVVVIKIIDIITSKIIVRALYGVISKTKSQWDDVLVERNFFTHLFRTIISILTIALIDMLFMGYSESLLSITEKIGSCFVILFVVKSLFAFISAAHDIYQTTEQAKEKSIKGYIQSLKIGITIVAILLALSALLGVSIYKILMALATSAAIITLVFKDTILGFIASIQLSAQDMVRLGDWIEMSGRGADGTVVDINVTTVKVRNWNNTMTMIPIYAMVSESYINWRTMEQGAGRRFLLPLSIDHGSICFMDENIWQNLRSHHVTKDIVDTLKDAQGEPFDIGSLTNLALYRSYVEHYIVNNPNINNSLTHLVRYLPSSVTSGTGVMIQIYAFTKVRGFKDYEHIVATINEHLVAAALLFGLRLFQRSGSNIQIENKQ